MSGIPHNWTTEQEAEVQCRLDEKETIKVIQRDMQLRFPTITYNSILHKIKIEGWENPGQANRKKLFTVEMDAQLTKSRTVYQLSIAELAKQLGIRQSRVSQRCKDLQLPAVPLGLKKNTKLNIVRPAKKLQFYKGLETRHKNEAKRLNQRQNKLETGGTTPKHRLLVEKHTPKPGTKLRGQCQYPIGEPCKPGFRFCYEPCERIYCAEHAAVCYL